MSSFFLKILAIIAMVIDHVGYAFLTENTVWYNTFEIIGRISYPIFAFQLCIGYIYTKNKYKHILTMLLFSLISQVPYMLFFSNSTSFSLNIGFTLLLGLLCLISLDNIKNRFMSILTVCLLLSITAFIPFDTGLYGVITIIFFYIFIKSKPLILVSQVVSNLFFYYVLGSFQWYQLCSLLSLIPIFLYNSKKGRSYKWLFYIFYPLHLFILFLIHKYIPH